MSTQRVAKTLNEEWVRQGATLKTFREMRGMKVDQLANLAGVSRPYLSNIEAGRKKMTPVLVARFASALHISQVALVRPSECTEAA